MSVLLSIIDALQKNPRITITAGNHSDLEISGTLAEMKWLLGKKLVKYNACLSLNESDQIILFWEMVSETTIGFPPIFTASCATYKTTGNTISGQKKEAGYGIGGDYQYTWSYHEIRNTVENIAGAYGWQVQTVLNQSAAQRR